MKDSPPPPPPRAVALRYDGKRAPTVIAKGTGDIARQILAIAEEHGIPLHEDSELVALLSRLDLGEEIPANLYRAVAQVIAFAYFVSGKMPVHGR
jgi:flagellar biosynthesis protein